ncbi:MAG: bifunctional pyr operon transcriptional regulator/uracil phosphoribosyltransferase PyrR [Chthoniobacterales bacterium]
MDENTSKTQINKSAPSGEGPTLELVMDAQAIQKVIRRIAHEIIEKYDDLSRLVIAGIPTRGVEVAKRIVEAISESGSPLPESGIVDVSMHRDDLSIRSRMTAIEPTHLPLDLDGRPLLLVDDVLFTGRSCRAAMDAVASYGRPSLIELAALVDRGHRELPIFANYVGKVLPTKREQKIRVRFQSCDRVEDSVNLVTP